jgi:hypothetical protein
VKWNIATALRLIPGRRRAFFTAFVRLILSSLLPVQGFRLKETLAVDPSG